MKYLLVFLLLGVVLADDAKVTNEHKECDPVKVGQVIDPYVASNMKQIESVSRETFNKELSDLCFGLRLNKSSEEFDLAVNYFLSETGSNKADFFSNDMFNLTCPNNEHFLHHVLKRNPVNFERLISQKEINYPKDIPREYIKDRKITLFDLLNEFRTLYIENKWGSKFGLFKGKLRKLGNE